MIKEVNEKDISECVRVIRDSFATVADQFGFTAILYYCKITMSVS